MKVAATSEGGAGGDLADFGVFDDTAAEFFDGGLQHRAAEIVAVDVEVGEGLEEAAEGLDHRVEFGEARGRLGVNEGGAPAVGFDEVDQVLLGLRFDARPEHAAAGLGSLPADVMEGPAGALQFEHVGGGERVGVGDGAVFLLGNLRGGDAEAKQAGVSGTKGVFDGRVIQKILVNERAQFGTGVHERAADDGANFVNDGRCETRIENSRASGTRCAKEKDFHRSSLHEG